MLEQKIAIVTGGGSGIGRAIAQRLHRDGLVVWVADKDERSATAVAADLQGPAPARAVVCDVTDRKSVQRVVDRVREIDGRVDVLAANAGVSSMRPFLDLTDEDWDSNMTVNARGAFVTMQVVASQMVAQQPREGATLRGKIIATASMAARQGAALLAHYSASKFAVTGLVHAAAKELAPQGITVNAVNPGFVRTAMQEREVRWEASLRGMAPDEVVSDYIRQTPLGRLEEPSDVAAVVSFLAGPDSDFMTGESIEVNGGAFIY